MKSEIEIRQIAKICHDANKAYCEVILDHSQVCWENAPDWQRESAIKGVQFNLESDRTTEQTHNSWLKEKQDNGWTFGPVKDPDKKEHPYMVPYAELPSDQKRKDILFRAIVSAFKD